MAYGNRVMPTVMAQGHQFARIPSVQIERSAFDRSHGFKTTFSAGKLVPFYVDEVLPGDTFTGRENGFVRLSTPIKPVMDNMYLETFYFFVPYRLVWANFKKFMGEQVNPGDSIVFNVPQITGAGDNGINPYLENSLEDYFGLPLKADVGAGSTYQHSALPFRAYALIWNEWFRDENIQNSVTVATGDGPDTPGSVVLATRGKRHDYFTSALPFLQKGTAVSIPLGTSATVKTNATDLFTGAQNTLRMLNTSGAQPGAGRALGTGTVGTGQNVSNYNNAVAGGEVNVYPSNLYADLSTATAATINALRQAFQLQKLLERDARGGTRYTEIVRSHFGVISPDARLQRPEYLGGSSARINISPVASTSSVPAQTVPQGNLSGVGTGSWSGRGFAQSFTEHGVVIGLMSVRADLTYQQGLERMWSRLTRYDFYWPSLAHLGEQAILMQEIYCKGSGGGANDATVFGYQERYAEYRYKPSRITGLFRSTYTAPLDMWHLSQKFTAAPGLNTSFINENPPMSRIKAVTTEPDFYCDMWIQLRCARPMPVYGVPGLIDHF